MADKKKKTGGIRAVAALADDLAAKGIEVTYSAILTNAFHHRFGGRLGGYSNISPSDISQYFRYKSGDLLIDDDYGEEGPLADE